MSIMTSPIAVGEQFRQDDGHASVQVVTIARIEPGQFGLDRVIFRGPDGREITTYMTQVEAALAEGTLSPNREFATLAGAA